MCAYSTNEHVLFKFLKLCSYGKKSFFMLASHGRYYLKNIGLCLEFVTDILRIPDQVLAVITLITNFVRDTANIVRLQGIELRSLFNLPTP